MKRKLKYILNKMEDIFWDLPDPLIFGSLLLLLLLLIGVPGTFGINELSKRSCSITADQMGVAYKYSIWTNCMIEINHHYIPLDNYAGVTQ